MKPIVKVTVWESVSSQGPVEDVIPPVRPHEVNITIYESQHEII